MTAALVSGDSAYVHWYATRSGAKQVEVEKVGRKLIYVKGHRYPFERDTGRERCEYSPGQLYTVREWEQLNAISEAYNKLLKAGITVSERRKAVPVLEALVRSGYEFG